MRILKSFYNWLEHERRQLGWRSSRVERYRRRQRLAGRRRLETMARARAAAAMRGLRGTRR